MVIKSCFALDMVTSLALASRWIRFETSLHRALQGPIDVFDTGKEPFLRIVTLIAVLVDGERPLLHIPPCIPNDKWAGGVRSLDDPNTETFLGSEAHNRNADRVSLWC